MSGSRCLFAASSSSLRVRACTLRHVSRLPSFIFVHIRRYNPTQPFLPLRQLRFGHPVLVGAGVLTLATPLYPLAHCERAVLRPPQVPHVLVLRDIDTPAVGVLYCLKRFLVLLLRFGPLLMFSVVAYCSASFREQVWYPWLYSAVASSGPTFIKLAQWAACRPDILPYELCRMLSNFHSQVHPHDGKQSIQIIEDAFGLPIRYIFKTFDEQPLASGSIAQIHRAVLFNGLEVAVKVRHPGIEYLLSADLSIMRFFAKLLGAIPSFEWLSIEEAVAEFGKTVQSQLNLAVEGYNLVTFGENFESVSTVKFPVPVLNLLQPTVLVESFEEGIPIGRFLNISHPKNRSLAQICMEAFLKMLFLDNFIHGDLHPGNVLVQGLDSADELALYEHTPSVTIPTTIVEPTSDSNGSSLKRWTSDFKTIWRGFFPESTQKSNLSVVLLDVGVTSKLSKQDWLNFIDLFEAVAEGNGRRGARIMVERAREQHCTDLNQFESEMESLFARARMATLSEIRVGEVLRGVLYLVQKHRVKIESNFASFVGAIIVLEGLGRQLNPEINVVSESIPFLVKAMRKLPENIQDEQSTRY